MTRQQGQTQPQREVLTLADVVAQLADRYRDPDTPGPDERTTL